MANQRMYIKHRKDTGNGVMLGKHFMKAYHSRQSAIATLGDYFDRMFEEHGYPLDDYELVFEHEPDTTETT